MKWSGKYTQSNLHFLLFYYLTSCIILCLTSFFGWNFDTKSKPSNELQCKEGVPNVNGLHIWNEFCPKFANALFCFLVNGSQKMTICDLTSAHVSLFIIILKKTNLSHFAFFSNSILAWMTRSTFTCFISVYHPHQLIISLFCMGIQSCFLQASSLLQGPSS